MKLCTTTIKKATCLLGALLLSGNCMASQEDKEALATQSTYLGMSLTTLAKANTKEYCSFDVDNSGTILQNTSLLIRGNRNNVAQDNLRFVTRALERVQSSRTDCPFFSSIVPPYIGQTWHLIHDLEHLAQTSS